MYRARLSRYLNRGIASPARASVRSFQPIRPVQTRSLATAVNVPSGKEPTDLDQVSFLPNGVRVASEALPGSFAGVGVYIEGGSRFENSHLSGVSHIIDRMAFQSSENRSAEDMQRMVESLGGNVQCVSSRESIMYQAATFNNSIPTATELLADTIQNPRLTEEEIERELLTAEYEIGEIWKRPDLIIPELVHMAAYKSNTLGNPLLIPRERIPEINSSVLRTYRDTFYRPERTVVAFAGIPHSEAVQLATTFFGGMKGSEQPTLSRTGSETSVDSLTSDISDASASSISSITSSSSQSSGIMSRIPLFKNLSTSASRNASISNQALVPTPEQIAMPSHYTGGYIALPPQPPSSNPNQPALTYIHLAFEGLPIGSDDIYALATLTTLLGGGGSFSAGGPGKGMYSRLYTNVLNQYHWVESCQSFNHSYTDSGLFGISAQCQPERTTDMLNVMCQELKSLTMDGGFAGLKQPEVDRAKNQLRSSLLMNLESRMVELEDLGRQVQVHGRKIPVQEMCRKIEKLTINDLRRVAKEVVGGLVQNKGKGSGSPTVVLQEAQDPFGSTKQASWEEIQDRIFKWALGRR
ncbi:peptidase M16 inactive domain-containing protein [Annulohypoxylon moriforme]|nr:peptidase M16 inactive domain-containing protein [Annulohypoxylon moriforme]